MKIAKLKNRVIYQSLRGGTALQSFLESRLSTKKNIFDPGYITIIRAKKFIFGSVHFVAEFEFNREDPGYICQGVGRTL